MDSAFTTETKMFPITVVQNIPKWEKNFVKYRSRGICTDLYPVAIYVFFGVREDWGLGWGARGVSCYFSFFPSHKTPRAPQPNPQSSLTPKNT